MQFERKACLNGMRFMANKSGQLAIDEGIEVEIAIADLLTLNATAKGVQLRPNYNSLN